MKTPRWCDTKTIGYTLYHARSSSTIGPGNKDTFASSGIISLNASPAFHIATARRPHPTNSSYERRKPSGGPRPRPRLRRILFVNSMIGDVGWKGDQGGRVGRAVDGGWFFFFHLLRRRRRLLLLVPVITVSRPQLRSFQFTMKRLLCSLFVFERVLGENIKGRRGSRRAYQHSKSLSRSRSICFVEENHISS